MKTLIKNVRLETGYKTQDDVVISTDTEIYDILIENGRFKMIDHDINAPADHVIDAQNSLIIPSFKDMHTHLDKTYFSDDWIAPMPAYDGVNTRISEEQKILVEQKDVVEDRAHALIQEYISQGHTHLRAHTNVDPVVKGDHIRRIKEVLSKYDGKITYDIVAFPQHGLLINGETFLNEFEHALILGATHVGGLDPATIDRNIEDSLEVIVQFAKKHNLGIDIHLHDGDTLGVFEIHTLLDLIEKHDFKNDVTVSHAFGIAGVSGIQFEELAKRLAKHNVSITTSITIGSVPITLPIFDLDKHGVNVYTGHDSITDHWSPFGTANTIEKLNLIAKRFGLIDEYTLSQSLKFATKGITPLNDQGERVWPAVNDEATFLLVDAISSAHMIARKANIYKVFSNGNIIHENDITLKGAYFG